MPSLFNVTPFEPIQPMLIKFVTKKNQQQVLVFLKELPTYLAGISFK